MNLITHRIEELPASFGSWDRLVQSARRQNAANQAHEDTREQRKAELSREMDKLMSKGDMRAHVFFAKRRSSVAAPKLFDELWDTAAGVDSLRVRMMTLLFFGSEGCDITAYAKELRALLCNEWAETECDNHV